MLGHIVTLVSELFSLTWDFIIFEIYWLPWVTGLFVIPLTSGAFVYNLICYISRRSKLAHLRSDFDRKRRQRIEETDGACQQIRKHVINDRNSEITDYSLSKIRQLLDEKKIRSLDVVKAFQAKAFAAHDRTNCLVEPIKEAQTEAFERDGNVRQGALLHGIPVSLKDDVAIKGYLTTTGASCMLGDVTKEDSALVKILRNHGAVPFMRTNQPQLGMSVEPGNPIYGTVRNPHDLTRSPGGSTSGEGALIGSGGSPLGFGSDIGGSIRIPAHFCGICGFKPTADRISHLGSDLPLLMCKESLIPVMWGPLARDVDSLVLAMRALWDGSMNAIDPLVPPMNFDENTFSSNQKLTIGYYTDNGTVAPVATVTRAINMAKQTLENAGHKLVQWNPPDASLAVELEYRALCADGGADLLKALEVDEVDPTLKKLHHLLAIPHPLKWIIAKTMSFVKHKDAMFVDASLGSKNVLEYWKLSQRIKDFQRRIVSSWQKQGLDAIICPPLPFPALQLGSHEVVMSGNSYMMMFNVLNFPAGVVRMTRVTSEDQRHMIHYPLRDNWHRQVKKAMIGAEGLPVGVQVASLRWKDEVCLRIMKEIEAGSD